ncbi:MAG: DUF2442 domain-containing protein [Phormidesmis sp. CAN_BIN44]|nr:DUF2442 domain-containing protein [Phormidesmis sp. CAN_BIN44]
MLKDIVAAQLLEGYQLRLKFEDEVEGIVDIAELIKFTGVFEPLHDRAYFAQVTVNPDLGTICWDNGADLDPDVLYSLVANQSLPDYAKSLTQ